MGYTNRGSYKTVATNHETAKERTGIYTPEQQPISQFVFREWNTFFFRFAQSPLCAIFNVRIEINRFFMTGNCRFRCSYFFIVAVGCVGLRKLCPF
jgi:hypothetical protein